MTILAPAATRTDLDVRLADTETVTFPILDSAGAQIDVSAWSAHAQIRHAAGDGLLYEWHTTPTGAQGHITMSAAGAALLFDGLVTADWTWRRPAQFDLFIFEPVTGAPHCVAAGRLRVIPPITTGV